MIGIRPVRLRRVLRQVAFSTKIADPGSLASEVEAAFLEMVDEAKASKVSKLANVGTRAVGLGKQGRALAALLFA